MWDRLRTIQLSMYARRELDVLVAIDALKFSKVAGIVEARPLPLNQSGVSATNVVAVILPPVLK